MPDLKSRPNARVGKLACMKALSVTALLSVVLLSSGCTAYEAKGPVCWITPPEHDWRICIGGLDYGVVAIAPDKQFGVERGTYVWCGRTYYWLPVPLFALLAVVGGVPTVAAVTYIVWGRRRT